MSEFNTFHHKQADENKADLDTTNISDDGWGTSHVEEKSPAFAAILAGLFGGFGLLYVTNFSWAITIVVVTTIFAFITGGVSMLATTLIFGFAGYYLANQHNEAVLRKRKLKGTLDSAPPTFEGFSTTIETGSSFSSPITPAAISCCGVDYTMSNKFCCSCGKKLIHSLPDTCCGMLLKPDAKFCSQCGKPRAATAA